jgi:hypothetical protein
MSASPPVTDEESLASLEQAIHDGRGWTDEEIDYLYKVCKVVDKSEIPILPHTGDQWHFLNIAEQMIISRVVRRLTDDEI